MLRNLDQKLYLPIVLIVGLIALLLSMIRRDILWSMISIVYLALMIGVSTVSHELEKKWDLIKFIIIPLFLGATGITGIFDNFILFLAILPLIAFIIILNLLHHTDFQADYDFKGNLITALTISTGAVLSFGRFFSDRFLGTMFLRGNIYLMIDLFFFTVFGIMGGISFKDYLMKINYSKLDRLRIQYQDNSTKRKKEFLSQLDTVPVEVGLDVSLLVSKILQIGILVLVIQGVFRGDIRIVLLSAPAFAFTMIPYLYTWNMEDSIPSFFHLVISASLFFYLIGTATVFYSYLSLTYFWWNRLVHFIGGAVGAFLIYIYLFYRNKISDELYLPTWLIPLIVLAILLSVSVTWELFEFFFDIMTGTSLQDNMTDTILDMIYNTLGSFFSISVTYLYCFSKR